MKSVTDLNETNFRAYELAMETIVYLGPKWTNFHFEISDAYNIGNRLIDGLKESQRNTAAIESSNAKGTVLELNSLSELMEIAGRDQELMPQIEVPLRFDVATSIFVLKVTKRGRLLGQISIKPSPTFGSSKFMQELGDFCYGNARKIGRRVTKVHKPNY